MSNGNLPQCPELRPVDVFPVDGEQGRKTFGIRDPQHITDKILHLPAEAAYALQFFDGQHTLPAIQVAFREKYKVEFPLELLEDLYRLLDSGHFLSGENFNGHYQSVKCSFLESRVRDAFHAGVSYDDNPTKLQESLGQLFVLPHGPGLPGKQNAGRRVPGIVVPHIDLRLGGYAYAWAYKELAEAETPDVFVILGTGHNGTQNPYNLTYKHFTTPLGEVPVEENLITRLRSLCSGELFADELSHRAEHTIEFQVLFIQQLFGNTIPIVPVLCSFSHLEPERAPMSELIESFIEALRVTLAEDGRRICLIASADLAHVGPRYGDGSGFDGDELEVVMGCDRELLQHVERVDPEGFRGYLIQEQDRRRICGFSPIYTMLKAIRAEKGRVVAHDHGAMDPIGSICSFASVVFE